MPIDSKVKRISLCPQHGDRVQFFADISSEVGRATALIEARLKGAATPAVKLGEESQ